MRYIAAYYDRDQETLELTSFDTLDDVNNWFYEARKLNGEDMPYDSFIHPMVPHNGGYDPEGMNGDRGWWGLDLCDRVQSLTHTDREDAVCDGISYFLHAALRLGQDPVAQLARAVQHFNEETSKAG